MFCSHNKYIKRWKQGLENGNRGIIAKTLSKHIKRYLLEKYGQRCSLCGWEKIHPITQIVPVEIDHICPNCHTLTPSFRNLNKGKGRNWRLAYLKSHP